VSVLGPRRLTATFAAAAGALALTTTAAAAGVVGVSPAEVSYDAEPGDVLALTTTVTTPEVPTKPDVVLLVDRTGSMGNAIDNVKANMAGVISTVRASQPDARFAVAEYCDFGDPEPAFTVVQDLTGDEAAVTAAVDSIALCSGGDWPEAQLNALWEIGSGAISFRPDSSRIVAWFGDAPAHDPSGGHTEADATTSLEQAGARVVAVSVGDDRLDDAGQASRITAATGGTLLTGVASDQVAEKILEGLTNLDVTVAADPSCDAGLAMQFEPGSQTVTSGEAATFESTIQVDSSATRGTHNCRIDFTLDGAPAGPDFVQTVHVNLLEDVTAPVVSCPPGPNPAGNEPSSSNDDGYYRMIAYDDVDPDVEIYVRDTASNLWFGPYTSGTTFKLTRAPGGKVEVKPFTGAVQNKFTLNGDAELTGMDASGNTATTVCSVAPNTA
jgi:von Willebrand factor type A domain